MACKEYQTHPRDSNLTFAVVWDPETGLEAYSGCELMCLRPLRDEYDFPESVYTESQEDDEGVVFSDSDGPFSVSGRSKTHFIDPHTPFVYEQYSRGLQSSSKTEKYPKSLSPPSTSTRPSSKWTFAALWDSKTGLSAFSQGKLSKFIPSTKHRKWPSISTSASTPITGHHSHGYIDNIKRGFYLRVLPEIDSHSMASSSPVEGQQHEPRFSCFDPLNECLVFEPRLHQFPQPSSTKGNHLSSAAQMNDDYVMKGDVLGLTGDPYLASRFSTSTTSTSGYVPIHPTSVHFIPPITFLGSRSSDSRSPKKRRRLLRSKSAGVRQETEECAIPRLFKNVPWSKSSDDDKWVFVEIRSVVTDRVVHEL